MCLHINLYLIIKGIYGKKLDSPPLKERKEKANPLQGLLAN